MSLRKESGELFGLDAPTEWLLQGNFEGVKATDAAKEQARCASSSAVDGGCIIPSMGDRRPKFAPSPAIHYWYVLVQ